MTFDLSPEELWILWGDMNRTGSITAQDFIETYWYSVGWRDVGTQQFIVQSDVDEDGDVDVRDGLIIDSWVAGIPTDGFRVGETETSGCGALPPLPVSPVDGVERGSGGGGR
jgi:hypothetical protein